MSYPYQYRNDGRTVSPGRVKLRVPKMTISSERTTSSSRSRSRDSNMTDDEDSRGSIGRRIGAQFFSGSHSGTNSNHSSKYDHEHEHLIMSVSQELERISSRKFSRARLGDSFISSSNLKTGILLEDNDISTSRTSSASLANPPSPARGSRDRERDPIPPPYNRFEDFRGFPRGNEVPYQDQSRNVTVQTATIGNSGRYQEQPRELVNVLHSQTATSGNSGRYQEPYREHVNVLQAQSATVGNSGRYQEPYREHVTVLQAQTATIGSSGSGRYQELLQEKVNVLPDKTPPPASTSSSVEDDITYVTEQLQIIQETQDSILNSLRTDIDVVQAENTLLSQKNLQLQSQVSHLNQLVADLSLDLRQMRDIVRSKQALGVSLSLLHGRDPHYFDAPDNNSMCVNYSSSPSQNSTGNQTTPSIILSHAQTVHDSQGRPRFQTQTSQSPRSQSRSSKERHHHRKSSHRSGSAGQQIPMDSKATSHTMKTKKRSKKGLKEGKSSNSNKSDTTNKANGNLLYTEPPMKSSGCFSKLFKNKKRQ